MNRWFVLTAVIVFALVAGNLIHPATAADADPVRRRLDAANPLRPLPPIPLGIGRTWDELDQPPTPEKVRLGRWLFYDTRLSKDNTVSCATCHRPANGFSEDTPVSTGVDGKQGTRKAPPVLNHAWATFPHFFWDGRAASLEEQAEGPMINPVEMAMDNHNLVIERLANVAGYKPYFSEAFGDDAITLERIVLAIADYERTRLSGNSPWDRWQAQPDEDDPDLRDWYIDEDGMPTFTDGKHVTAEVKLGSFIFHNVAACNQCHLGHNFSDYMFHNLGVGYDAEKKTFADIGRYVVTQKDEDKGAFKTPILREVASHAPYMHDGSIKTLRDVVELYNRGGEANPHLSTKVTKLNLTDEQIDAVVAFMQALSGEGYMDEPPAVFPQ